MKTFMKTVVAVAVVAAASVASADYYTDYDYDGLNKEYKQCVIEMERSSLGGRVCTPPLTCEEYYEGWTVSGWSCSNLPPVRELYCGHFTNEDGYLTVRNVYVDSVGGAVGPVLFYEVEPLVFEVREYIGEDGVKHIVE